MYNHNAWGTIVLNVSTRIEGVVNLEEALYKINELINELTGNIEQVQFKAINGEVHNLKVHNFHIEWEDVTE